MITISADQIKAAENAVKGFYMKDRTGHGWDHIMRVKNLAIKIAEIEGVQNINLIECISLLHDAGDEKLHDTRQSAESFLHQTISQLYLNETEEAYLLHQVKSVSYRNRHLYQGDLESKIVSDADRLDALGAIGVARAFTYGGAHEQKMHSYKTGEPTVIAHFNEKLLHLKDEMHTKTAYKIAIERDRFLNLFKDQFLNEWNGKK
ncbi:HD domain-containing protein [Jeotgalibacillus haloalkalitolerans]|uniref:HD domain-containing protein n=1 Tax=Jeotgalibacillus haloalkalitolerans TaxID=3104292 RepID=A0ABU5KL07_9BACL|nr:HD domain-containing protein [Jeotgalibacillus sp. HH7-29]MDZ5711954.1 HD domain-containing protein [Jeotgalibacillus sp. HH7-29]